MKLRIKRLFQCHVTISLLLNMLICAVTSPTTVQRYDGFHVLLLGHLTSADDVMKLENLTSQHGRQVLLLDDAVSVGSDVTLLVSPALVNDVIAAVKESRMTLQIVDGNFQRSVEQSRERNELARRKLRVRQRSTAAAAFDHSTYLEYTQQEDWLLAKSMESGQQLMNIAVTTEGRSVWVFSINDSENYPAVWVDANMSGREWLSSATALYVIDKILTDSSADALYLRNNFRFYFAPNINPDGYAYTWTTDAMWVKTRSVNEGSGCTGVNINRNFPVAFGGSGSSRNCSMDNYCGPFNLSEVESRAMRDFIDSLAGQVRLYFSLRAYKQRWYIPWAYTNSRADDHEEMQRVAEMSVVAINSTNNAAFSTGTLYDLNEQPVSGTSVDWAKQQAGITYSYQLFLRPLTYLVGGYQPDPSNIVLSGEEIFSGLVEAVRQTHTL